MSTADMHAGLEHHAFGGQLLHAPIDDVLSILKSGMP